MENRPAGNGSHIQGTVFQAPVNLSSHSGNLGASPWPVTLRFFSVYLFDFGFAALYVNYSGPNQLHNATLRRFTGQPSSRHPLGDAVKRGGTYTIGDCLPFIPKIPFSTQVESSAQDSLGPQVQVKKARFFA